MTGAWSDAGTRLRTYALLAVAAALGLASARIWAEGFTAGFVWPVDADRSLYVAATQRWLGGGPFYHPYQLAGPYVVTSTGGFTPPILYPPPVALLLIPFAWLPDALSAALWWLVPLGTVAWRVAALRPSWAGWAAIAACLAWPGTAQTIVPGNPGMWLAAAVALGLGPFVLLKPTLLPFAVVGVIGRDRNRPGETSPVVSDRQSLVGTTRRSRLRYSPRDLRSIRPAYLASLALVLVLSAVTLPLWPDYLVVLRNADADAGLLYSWGQVPWLLVPLIARWTAGTRERAPARALRGLPAPRT